MNDDKDTHSKAEMIEPSKSRPASKAPPSAKESASKVGPNNAPPAQDRWFDIQLGRMYSDLAAEPVPSDMMALIQKLKENPK